MFDVAPSEFLIVALVALVVIGPKDLPKAMRVVGYWVGKARGVARQFRAGFDDMVREAELAEMEQKWAAENARILAEHPATTADEPAALPAPPAHDTAATAPAPPGVQATPNASGQPDLFSQPVMVEKPAILPGDEPAAAPLINTDAKAAS